MGQSVLIIHGGAGRRFQAPERRRRLREKIARILSLAHKKLCVSDALQAVTYAVRLLEDDPEFNAGTGSHLQADGHARLAASIMDGSRKRFAAVINLEHIRNPILVARALLNEGHRVLSDRGAFHYAKTLGLRPRDTKTQAAVRRWLQWKEKGFDTVGACALDRAGHLASATSTGGRGFETPWRVSDSGMPVSNYADARCAISVTGIGEEIVDEGVAIKLATRIQDGLSLRRAFLKTFREISFAKRSIGAVGLDHKGHITHQTTTELLIYGWKRGKRSKIF